MTERQHIENDEIIVQDLFSKFVVKYTYNIYTILFLRIEQTIATLSFAMAN